MWIVLWGTCSSPLTIKEAYGDSFTFRHLIFRFPRKDASLCGTPRSYGTAALNLQGRDLFRSSTCFASFMSQLLLESYSHVGEAFCVLKGGPENITVISLGARMSIKVGQILFWVTLVYSPSNLTGFGGIIMPCILRIKAEMSYFERINPTAIAIWFFLCKQWSDEGQIWKKCYTSQSIYKAKTLEKILVEHVETALKTLSSFISSCPVVFLALLQIHFITWCWFRPVPLVYPVNNGLLCSISKFLESSPVAQDDEPVITLEVCSEPLGAMLSPHLRWATVVFNVEA